MARVEPKAVVKPAVESWYQQNKNKLGCKLRLKSWRLKTRYGITLKDYESLLEAQSGLCKICEENRPLHVDHCHNTGKIRGLLCFTCNNGLGNFKDKLKLLENAVQYLKTG